MPWQIHPTVDNKLYISTVNNREAGMKRLVILLLIVSWTFIFTTSSSLAGGAYDGIWTIPGSTVFFTVNQNGNNIAVVFLNSEAGTWEVLLGSLNGNSARMMTIYGYVGSTVDVIFHDVNNATGVQQSCTPWVPGWFCGFPNNVPLPLQRIW